MILRGRVTAGLGIGRQLGYPTANISYDGAGPAPGVYAARCVVDDVAHNAVVVVGTRQDHGRPLVEVLILDFQGDLYGKTLAVEVLAKVSDIEQCADEVALKRKIEEDIKDVRLCLQG